MSLINFLPFILAQALPQIDLSIGGEAEDFSLAIQALILITVLSFGPAFITMMTSFTRIIIVFFFLRMGLGTQQSPPNQVLIGLALFLTIFIIMSTFNALHERAIQPYLEEEMVQAEALTEDRKSTRLNSSHVDHLVCRLL